MVTTSENLVFRILTLHFGITVSDAMDFLLASSLVPFPKFEANCQSLDASSSCMTNNASEHPKNKRILNR